MSMFQRMFGRRRSPIEGESGTSAVEATEETPDEISNDGFVVVDDSTSRSSGVFDPPPGYTLGGANAFLPYGLDPKVSPTGNLQRTISTEPQSAIDGVPFKLGSNVLLEGSFHNIDLSVPVKVIEKINLFNWDEYEYSFNLERSILQEFDTTKQETPSE